MLEQVAELCRKAGARLVVNDRADLARIFGAGLHLGQDDLPPADSRRVTGPSLAIGFSTHNFEQALHADRLPVDYIAVGPIFPTATKENPDPVVGLQTLARICKTVRKPVVAIGGTTIENAVEVLHAGASSIAVIRDVLDSPDVVSQVQRWIQLLNMG